MAQIDPITSNDPDTLYWVIQVILPKPRVKFYINLWKLLDKMNKNYETFSHRTVFFCLNIIEHLLCERDVLSPTEKAKMSKIVFDMRELTLCQDA